MARFEKSRPKSAKPHAAVAPARPRGSTAPSIEDTMFFPRLRRHAKWMFVFLALVFGLGFVVFGVGAGGTGVGDIFRDSNGSTAQSVSDARKETEQRPKDAQAWRDYATALETEGQTAEAIVALNTAIDLKPKDETRVSRARRPPHVTRHGASARRADPPGPRGLPRAVAGVPASDRSCRAVDLPRPHRHGGQLAGER